jgi:molecular chaperone DnaJ
VLLAPCADCKGEGEVTLRRVVDAEVPPRCRDGATLRVRGGGESAAGQAPGDLLVEVQIEAHPLLVADGDDLVCRVPVTWSDALQGATLTVPTLHGVQRLALPPMSTSGVELRVAGHGLPKLQGGKASPQRGALRVQVAVDIPTAPTAELVAAVAQLPAQQFARVQAYAAAVSRLAQQETPS